MPVAAPSHFSHSHDGPQLDEHDPQFVALELPIEACGHSLCIGHFSLGGPFGNPHKSGCWHICRDGLEKMLHVGDAVRSIGDVDVRQAEDTEFECPVWRAGNCVSGAGERDYRVGGGEAYLMLMRRKGAVMCI